jgi:hypothetical protein
VINPPFSQFSIGQANIEPLAEGAVRLNLPANNGQQYHNAQIYNYAGSLKDLPSAAPVRLSLRAWASQSGDTMRGTFGFGFWNQPFMPGQRWPRLPRYLWFFGGGPPHNMALAKGVPGFGWKAATADFSRAGFLALLPSAPIGFLLMRNRALYQRLWGVGQTAIGAAEKLLNVDVRQPHQYQIDWLPNCARFYVDSQLVLQAPSAPAGKLGFIAWLDNQYAIVTPQGGLGFGLVPVPEPQWLVIEQLQLSPIDGPSL